MYLIYMYIFLSLTLSAISSASSPDLSTSLQNILNQAHKNPLYDYPTSLTRGIIPKGIHSHNDYWRKIPFYTALSVGCISIEADVWLYNDTLFVGHERSALTPARTFTSLYINPILDTLARQNPKSKFVDPHMQTYNGVYDTSSGQTLYLFVDVKTDGVITWPVVVRELEPLRTKGYLTNLKNNTLTTRPITIIGTGNTPLSQIQPLTTRDYFWDAPLPLLTTTYPNITSLVSPIASTDFTSVFGSLTDSEFNTTQLELLREQISVAKARGIAARYWNQPAWPVGVRNGIWKTLVREGVGLVNVDDVEGAAGEVW